MSFRYTAFIALLIIQPWSQKFSMCQVSPKGIIPPPPKRLYDDLFNYVSFVNVSQWDEIYPTCSTTYNYTYFGPEVEAIAQNDSEDHDDAYNQKIRDEVYGMGYTLDTIHILSLNSSRIPHHLSPIPLPDSTKAIPIVTNRSEATFERVLHIFNNKPPPLNSFYVSFGFPRNKECVASTEYSPCYVTPTFGKIRGVILGAHRDGLRKLREEYAVEEPEKFATIVNGGSDNERKFYEALFMGSKDGSGKVRSTHTINGKGYPMEIYLFFVDETLPVMAGTTILVVLVEESERENKQVRPIANAVTHQLYVMEQTFLRQNAWIAQREMMFHRLGLSTANLHTLLYNVKRKWTPLPPSLENEGERAVIMDHFERLQYFQAKTKFVEEEFSIIRGLIKEPENFLQSIKDGTIFQGIWNNVLLLARQYQKNLAWLCDTALTLAELGVRMYLALSKKDIINPRENLNWENMWPGIVERAKALSNSQCDTSGVFLVPEIYKSINDTRDTFSEFHKLRRIFDKEMENPEMVFLKTRNAFDTFFETLLTTYDLVGNGVGLHRNEIQVVVNLVLYIEEVQMRAAYRKNIQIAKTKIQNSKEETGYIMDGVDVNGTKFIEDQLRIFLREDERTKIHRLKYNDYKRREPRLYSGKVDDRDNDPDAPIESGMIGNLGLSDKSYNGYEALQPIKFNVPSEFQISWLLPSGGGYYYYKGSSPVPPCYHAHHTIVFKRPIKMSRDQIEALSYIPTSHIKARDITNTLGILRPPRVSDNPEVNIYFDKRNHQFMRSDNFHKNSILARRDRDLANIANAIQCVLMNCFPFIIIFLILL